MDGGVGAIYLGYLYDQSLLFLLKSSEPRVCAVFSKYSREYKTSTWFCLFPFTPPLLFIPFIEIHCVHFGKLSF